MSKSCSCVLFCILRSREVLRLKARKKSREA
nr:MAG TPA: hypothetical protein [Caudoviricetes sp.]